MFMMFSWIICDVAQKEKKKKQERNITKMKTPPLCRKKRPKCALISCWQSELQCFWNCIGGGGLTSQHSNRSGLSPFKQAGNRGRLYGNSSHTWAGSRTSLGRRCTGSNNSNCWASALKDRHSWRCCRCPLRVVRGGADARLASWKKCLLFRESLIDCVTFRKRQVCCKRGGFR